MQLNPGLAPAPEDFWDAPKPEQNTPRSTFLVEYEARRCQVCQSKHPPFGYGPPLTPVGHEIWACTRHRETIERMLAEALRPKPADRQQTLL
jgi:hypothetical protein